MPQSKKERPSSTAGKSKGENCHRSVLKNQYAKDSKMYKTEPKNYANVCLIINAFKGNLKSQWIEEMLHPENIIL